MRTTMVPAQVTTVEDRIAGSLTLSQLMLLCAPVFISAGLYILFPPILKFTIAKMILTIILAIIFSGLSIRIKGKLALQWVVIIGRYNMRPHLYLYDKNDLHLRVSGVGAIPIVKKITPEKLKKSQPKLPKMPVPQLLHLQNIVNDPRAKLSLQGGKKGGLHVHITQIK